MNKTLFHFPKTAAFTLAIVASFALLFGSARQTSAADFGVSINLGGTAISFGIGDSKPTPTVPVVIEQAPAIIPPVAMAPKPEPRPRFVRQVTPAPVPMRKVVPPSPRNGTPTFRSQAPEKSKKPPRNYSPVEAARARR